MKKPDIIEFYTRLETAMPEPRGELNFVNAYTLLVAVVLCRAGHGYWGQQGNGPIIQDRQDAKDNGRTRRSQVEGLR